MPHASEKTHPSQDSFTHNNLLYDLTQVRLLVQKHPAFILPIKDLLWIQKHDAFQEDRVQKAKLRYPLLVVKWRGKWVVVDGLHRLERYRRMGFTYVPVKLVPEDILKRTRIHV